jgi:hypothetical protein
MHLEPIYCPYEYPLTLICSYQQNETHNDPMIVFMELHKYFINVIIIHCVKSNLLHLACKQGMTS